MIYDSLGLPKDVGATDLQDSSRLAGTLVAFDWPRTIPIEKYVVEYEGKLRYQRHPLERIYDFSRDQSIPLIAGLYKSGNKHLVNKDYIDGKDFFSPSHLGHIRRCKGEKANFFQDLWLWGDVLWSCYVKPKAESNQLLCMLLVADDKYLKFWLKNNKFWKESIKEYWIDSYRNEKELGEYMIRYLENV